MAVQMVRTARITNIKYQALGQAFHQRVTGQVHSTYFQNLSIQKHNYQWIQP